ncbi:hypothetical protein [Paenirhodobacter populi]|uniref:Uncharacterized protein n=1 Tax=Paenirhodobacter populi TaxID=2306993 RepID=A0A443J043_9RHOB|nr:hypothetical protein [Sinirhodobacter populi]RWR13824.1 hypothetical protein D2T33_05345 [Sinirhodobacter populi]
MIDVTNPIATPFRADWSVQPRTDYEFKTNIMTAADGSEQRSPKNRFPRVRIRFSCLARGERHAARITEMRHALMTSALAVRDFRMGSEGKVSADGMSVQLNRWSASWAVGMRVIIEDGDGMAEHTALLTSVDPASRTMILGVRAPTALRGSGVGVSSAVVCSLDGDMRSDLVHAGAVSWEVSATSFGGVDPIGGAPREKFPFTHGAPDAMRITTSRSVLALDFGVGRRQETLGYASDTSGFRTFQVETRQMGQLAKEDVISFFCGCRGRLRSFSAERLDPEARFRFGSDVLTVEHLSGNVSSATMNLVQVRR